MSSTTTQPVERFYLQPTTFSPNSPLPVLVYRNVLPQPHSESATTEFLEGNNWERRGTFGHIPTPHFHPNTHECYGIFQGSSTLRIGKGKHDSHSAGILIPVTAGDVIVLPAGITHSCVDSIDYRYVGVYPKKAPHWRNEFGKEPIDLVAVRKETSAVEMPEADPVYGTEGPLVLWWAEEA
ncbi:hypothetical protein PAAG_01254 [Paracoccidioides lutzii Pb01]|uniref:Cupin type-1 domain-containing protein n=1 Tax=Paracoccidioides lutzii (strain ATCC MYA-826 / Pb01) TaxID=502779 RepID=C1GRV9_PARBA|nr:hypothetical protein PAAG_01254 [Paracoccidioides lutzii Pb01]EEH38333.2 hypothetical protein PAAG_01254 [Paracoccidioides lutzii Pb01]